MTRLASCIRLRPGLYRHIATGRAIVCTDGAYAGPRGGRVRSWERGRFNPDGSVVLDDWTAWPTLRAAVAQIEWAESHGD